MFCRNCGQELPNDSKFCPECGYKVGLEPSGNAEKVVVDSRGNKSAKKIGIIVFAVICVVTLLFVAIKGLYGDDKMPDNTFTETDYSDNETQEDPITTQMELSTTQVSTEEVTTEDLQMQYASAYDALLAKIYEYIASNGENDMVDEGCIGIMELLPECRDENPLSCFGYCIEDINEDDIPELVICSKQKEDENEYYGKDMLSVYTLVDGQPQLSFEGMVRHRYLLGPDNRIYSIGSGSAFCTILSTYVLEPGDTSLTCEECYFSDSINQNLDIGYFHNDTGDVDKDNSEQIDMTSDEFKAMIQEIEDSAVFIPITLFSQWYK